MIQPCCCQVLTTCSFLVSSLARWRMCAAIVVGVMAPPVIYDLHSTAVHVITWPCKCSAMLLIADADHLYMHLFVNLSQVQHRGRPALPFHWAK
jgi:hypothetical protein